MMLDTDNDDEEDEGDGDAAYSDKEGNLYYTAPKKVPRAEKSQKMRTVSKSGVNVSGDDVMSDDEDAFQKKGYWE